MNRIIKLKNRDLGVAKRQHNRIPPPGGVPASHRHHRERLDVAVKPVMANELERNAGDAVQHSAALDSELLAAAAAAPPRLLLLNPNDVDLEDVGGGYDEVGDGADSALGRGGPVGLEVVAGGDGNLHRSCVGDGVGYVAGGAVLDAGGPMHHLEGRETHLSGIESNRIKSVTQGGSERLSNLGVRLNAPTRGFYSFSIWKTGTEPGSTGTDPRFDIL